MDHEKDKDKGIEKIYLKILGFHIRKRRDELGLTQEMLSEKAKISTDYLGRIEGGKQSASSYVIHKLCIALNDYDDLHRLVMEEMKKYDGLDRS